MHQATAHMQIIHIGWAIMSSPLPERFIWKNNGNVQKADIILAHLKLP